KEALHYVLTYRGWAYLERGQNVDARANLSTALQIQDGAVAHYLMGRALNAPNPPRAEVSEAARQQWIAFLNNLQTDPKQMSQVPTDWISDAQEKIQAKGVQ